MAGAKEVEEKEPSTGGDDGNICWGPQHQAKEFGLYLVWWDGKSLAFLTGV